MVIKESKLKVIERHHIRKVDVRSSNDSGGNRNATWLHISLRIYFPGDVHQLCSLILPQGSLLAMTPIEIAIHLELSYIYFMSRDQLFLHQTIALRQGNVKEKCCSLAKSWPTNGDNQ